MGYSETSKHFRCENEKVWEKFDFFERLKLLQILSTVSNDEGGQLTPSCVILVSALAASVNFVNRQFRQFASWFGGLLIGGWLD